MRNDQPNWACTDNYNFELFSHGNQRSATTELQPEKCNQRKFCGTTGRG